MEARGALAWLAPSSCHVLTPLHAYKVGVVEAHGGGIHNNDAPRLYLQFARFAAKDFTVIKWSDGWPITHCHNIVLELERSASS
uniref:Uncharacterized protein n=1 Tax=Oryza barthii TaxID=65489 RepID=A0A0D3GQ31_9ORYZ